MGPVELDGALFAGLGSPALPFTALISLKGPFRPHRAFCQFLFLA